jgi:hypothetical protein
MIAPEEDGHNRCATGRICSTLRLTKRSKRKFPIKYMGTGRIQRPGERWGRKALEALAYADMAADAAGADRQVAVDQFAAAASEDRWPFDEVGPLLLVAANGK